MFNNNHKFNMLKTILSFLSQRNSYVIQAMLKVEAPELHPSTIASKQRLFQDLCNQPGCVGRGSSFLLWQQRFIHTMPLAKYRCSIFYYNR